MTRIDPSRSGTARLYLRTRARRTRPPKETDSAFERSRGAFRTPVRLLADRQGRLLRVAMAARSTHRAIAAWVSCAWQASASGRTQNATG